MSNIVVAIIGDKGGIGKTTIAYNLLRRLMDIESSCILIDCDNDQHSSTKLMLDRRDNGVSPDLAVQNMSTKNLESNILELSKKYKIIIVEFGKAIGDMEEEERSRAIKLAVKIADKIIMPIQPTRLDTETIGQIEQKLISFGIKDIPALIVPNRVMSKKQLKALLSAESALDYFKIAKSHIKNRLCYQEVHDNGMTIFDITNPKNKSTRDAIQESEQIFQEIFYG